MKMIIVRCLLQVSRSLHAKLRDEFFRGGFLFRLVRGDGDHLDALGMQLSFQFHQLRKLSAARRAPCGPEIVEDDLALVSVHQFLEAGFVERNEWTGSQERQTKKKGKGVFHDQLVLSFRLIIGVFLVLNTLSDFQAVLTPL